MSMKNYVLKEGYTGLFEVTDFQKDTNYPSFDGFKEISVPAFRITLTALVAPPQGTEEPGYYYLDDCENSDAPLLSSPQVVIVGASEFAGKGKNASPFQAGLHNGRDVVAWATFFEIVKYLGINAKVFGVPQPMPGKTIQRIALRVGAVPGKQQYAPKNIIRDWAPSMERFKQEDEAAASAFDANLQSAPDVADPFGGSRPVAPPTRPGKQTQAQVTPAVPPARKGKEEVAKA